MEKRKLRKCMLQHLETLSPEEKLQIESKIYASIYQSNLWKSADAIGITCSQNFEWNTFPIIEEAWAINKKVAIPKSFPENKQLKFYLLENMDDLVQGYANILEPDIFKTKPMTNEIIDLLIVPGIVFDQKGYRIGFGGGFYDRFLQQQQFVTISLAANFQLIENIPNDSFDIPIQHIVTETKWINTI